MKRGREKGSSSEKENDGETKKKRGKRGPYFQWLRDGKEMPRNTRFYRSASAAGTNRPAPTKKKPLKPTQNNTRNKKQQSIPEPASVVGSSETNTLNGDNNLFDDLHLSCMELKPTDGARPNDEMLLDVGTTQPSEEVADVSSSYIETESTPNTTNEENILNDQFVVVEEDTDTEECPNDDDEIAYFDDEDSFTTEGTTDQNSQSPPNDSSDDDNDFDIAEASELNLTINQKVDLLLLLATKKRHNLSYSASEDVMNLAGVLSSDKNGYLPTRHIMKRTIELYSACDITEHHVCPECGLYIGVLSTPTGRCENCQSNFNTAENEKKGNMFLCISLRKQIESIIRHCHKEIVDPKKREKICEFNYEDIYDGKIYKSQAGDGIITFNFFVDGLQVASTSKQSAWPVLGCLNELPLPLRRKYVFMACLWLGLKKPNCQEYLKPFVKECNLLARDGIQFKTGRIHLNFQVKPLMCVSDTIARPLLRNSVQFNGRYGCGLCYHPGVWMKYRKGHVRSYTLRQGEFPLRTHEEIMDMAVIAENRGIPRRGIKGRSILSEISGFNIARGLDLDFFHALVNVSKRFANLWFFKKFRRLPFSCHAKYAEVDCRLLKITPTSHVSRAPRSLNDRTSWRGHEWFHWVFEYSIPVLKNILPARFLNHWGLLVHAVALLMQNSVSKSDVGYASRFLLNFVTDIDQYYGPEHVTISVHLLTHLSDSVKDFGQPWTHSAFVFESFNHELKQFVKSSNGVAKQMSKGIQLKVALKNLEECVRDEMSTEQKDYFQKMTVSLHSLTYPHLVIGDIALLGEPKAMQLTPATRRILGRKGIDCKSVISVYERCIIDGETYQTLNYSKVSRQCNYIALLTTYDIFSIEHFLVAAGDCFVLGKCFKRNRVTKLCTKALPHLLVLHAEPEQEVQCYPASEIQSKLLSFCVDITETERVRIACINVLQNEMLR